MYIKNKDMYTNESVKVDGLVCKGCKGTDFQPAQIPNMYRCITCHQVTYDDRG